MIAERPDRATRRRRTRGVLVVGAGSGGQMVVRELRLNPNLGARAIGFVDDDPRKRGMHAVGVKVLGSTDEIGEILDRKAPDEVVIAIPSAPGVLRAKVVAACRERDIAGAHAADRVRAAARRRPAHPPAARGQGRGRAGTRSGGDGAGARRRLPGGQDRHGHGGGRLDRRRALPPDRPRAAEAAGAARPRRGQPVPDRPRDARRMALHPGRGGARRLQGGRADARGDAALQAGRRLPRRRLQARAADGGESRSRRCATTRSPPA